MQKRFLIITIFAYAFLYLPIVFMVMGSFNASSILGHLDGFSLRWYKELLQDKITISSLIMSLRIAFISATFSVLLAIIAALFKIKSPTIKIGINIPIIIPDTVMGLSLLLLMVFTSSYFGFPRYRGIMTISIAHITLAFSYSYIIIRNRFRDFDYRLIEASYDLGAGKFATFMQVTLPIIFPTIFSAWLLSFTLSFDDLILASFLSGPGTTTLPMVIFSQIRFGVTPKINALASIMILFVIIGLMVTYYVSYKSTTTNNKNNNRHRK